MSGLRSQIFHLQKRSLQTKLPREEAQWQSLGVLSKSSTISVAPFVRSGGPSAMHRSAGKNGSALGVVRKISTKKLAARDDFCVAFFFAKI
jgi:hypothetical protein